MAFQNILVEQKERIACITLNRETKMNALNQATLAELNEAFTQAFTNENIGGIIITGTGSKAFVAGGDISEFAALDEHAASEMARDAHNKVFNLIENGNKPVVAAVNGFALGGGLELAMACHIRVASSNAKLGLPEVTLGLIPGYGGTQRLTRLVGKGRALEMMMTADMITAEEAYRYGLINHVVSADELLPKAEEILQKILLRAPLAVAAVITAANAASRQDVNGFETEILEFGKCFATTDMKEGVSAFLEKRKPAFKGL
ncbi:enoyl-CoA hydratase [Mucilaginibacter hurinus]|uniref:Enoyl-CoA hydratase n=1 Tax=Mucilaginibacter hurinus TaxID=2201324 RepID=A0A367GPU0_9SPHI|nr:enoyl-CoA hydratase-related protein [Mucilaginibacter hurinus]RCH55474.1 enoyl-CoA hydratase [Mucilaginibacter hurinus]